MVLEDAALRLQRDGMMVDGLVERLREQDVVHTWQLKHLEREDWIKAGVTTGMRIAVRTELLDPQAAQRSGQTVVRVPATPNGTTLAELSSAIAKVAATDAAPAFSAEALSSPAVYAERRVGTGEKLTPFQRRFLLRPSVGAGGAVRSLGSMGAAFLGTMLVVPVEEQQQLYLAAGELLGVLAGLLLPVPLSFVIPGESQDASTEVTLRDGFNALAFASFFFFLISMLGALLMAMVSVFQGWKAAHIFYEELNHMFAVSFLMFVGGFWTLVCLVLWKARNACHWLCTAAIAVMFLLSFQWLMYHWAGVYVKALPLEFFHLPLFFRLQFQAHRPFGRLHGSHLREAAQVRAAALSKLLYAD
jgi:hypothetical protein